MNYLLTHVGVEIAPFSGKDTQVFFPMSAAVKQMVIQSPVALHTAMISGMEKAVRDCFLRGVPWILNKFRPCAVERSTVVDELVCRCSGRVGGEARGVLNIWWTVQRRLWIFGVDDLNRLVPSIRSVIYDEI